MDPMDEATERQQIKFAVQTVSFAIEDALKAGKTHLFYSEIVDGDYQPRPCVLKKHVLNVVISLQRKYRGVAVVSRTPGGIVWDKI
uniref:Uncharacterized protein n=1 Tax=viral metagenome TaxID=1070528 RepID=A0A6C0JGS7_9ZZZZ